MKAVVLYGQEDLRVEDAPAPSPVTDSGPITMKNAYSGICGSDLHFYFALDSVPYDVHKPHPLTGAKLPQILGHEFSGTVVEVNEGVTGIAVDDRGAIHSTVVICGTCTACKRGAPMTCRPMGALGATVIGGELAEFSVANAAQFHRLPPENVSLRDGALVEPMSAGWHGVEKILVSEPSTERRQTPEAHAAATVDPIVGDLAAEIGDGEGIDTVIAAMSNDIYDTSGWVEERELDDVVDALHQLHSGTGSKILLRIS